MVSMLSVIKKNKILFVASIIIFLVFFARLLNLNSIPVFADEAIYVRWSQVMRAEETLRFLPLSDGKQPLYMWVTIPFLKLIKDPLIAARILSVLSGFGTFLGVGVLSWLFFKNKKVTVAAMGIYAFTPFAFFFDRMALADSLLSMFGLWTFILSYLTIKTVRLDFALLAGFALGGAWLTKSPALFFALLIPTLWVFVNKSKDLYKVVPLSLVTLLVGYGFYNILRLGPNFHMIAMRNQDYVYPLNHFLTRPLDPLKPFILQAWQWITVMGPWEVLLLAVAGIYFSWKKYWKTFLVLFIWFLGPIVVESEFAKVFTARYIFFTIPYLVITASTSLLNTKKSYQKLLIFVFAFYLAQSLVFDYYLIKSPEKANLPRSERSGYLEEWTAGQGIREVSVYLKNQLLTDPTKKIVIGTEGYFGTLPDGLQIHLNDKPEITVIGVGIDLKSIPTPLIESQESGNRTFLLINSDRLKFDYKDYDLSLVSSFEKALRPDGTRQTLLLFELPQNTI